MIRKDDFEIRRKHLKELSDDELYKKFWELTEEIVKPMIDLAYKSTSPAIERSVVLRMGFSSIEADSIVKHGIKWNLLGKGLGNVILTYADMIGETYIEAGLKLSQDIGWKEVHDKMRGEKDA